MKRRASPSQIAAANEFARTQLKPAPLTLCDKIGRAGNQLYVCRFREGHGGHCYWHLHGAVLEQPLPARPDPPCITDPAQHEWHFSDSTHRHVCVECGYVATLAEEAADAAAADFSISVPTVLPTPAWVQPQPYVSDALPPWYDDDIPGYIDDLVLPEGD